MNNQGSFFYLFHKIILFLDRLHGHLNIACFLLINLLELETLMLKMIIHLLLIWIKLLNNFIMHYNNYQH